MSGEGGGEGLESVGEIWGSERGGEESYKGALHPTVDPHWSEMPKPDLSYRGMWQPIDSKNVLVLGRVRKQQCNLTMQYRSGCHGPPSLSVEAAYPCCERAEWVSVPSFR